jgi:hypothetical protein
VNRARAHAEASRDGALGESLIQEMFENHESISPVHGAVPLSWRGAKFAYGPEGAQTRCSEHHPAERRPECAILSGDCGQTQTGANSFLCLAQQPQTLRDPNTSNAGRCQCAPVSSHICCGRPRRILSESFNDAGNDAGPRCWFARLGVQLGGQVPAAVRGGARNPDDAGLRRLLRLAASLLDLVRELRTRYSTRSARLAARYVRPCQIRNARSAKRLDRFNLQPAPTNGALHNVARLTSAIQQH